MAANKQINQYSAAVSIDASADYLLIDPGGTGNYNKINRNVLLGLTSAPLGTTDSQSPQNKTFDNTNSLTIKDGSLTIQNSSSTTKQAVFSAASITAGQTRTLTIPDVSGTLVLTAATQTLTNKTITSPTISGGTIDNTTITVDSISGHTSGTIVTVANLQISNGVLNSANAVTATSIAAGAVQPQALQSGTGTGWSWQSWTPTWTNLTAGNAVVTAKYVQTGKTVHYSIVITFGNISSMGTNPNFTLPVTSVSYPVQQPIGLAGMAVSSGGTLYPGGAYSLTNTTGAIFTYADSAGVPVAGITSTTPFTWTNGSVLTVTGMYQAA